jgi:hypothetical protein
LIDASEGSTVHREPSTLNDTMAKVGIFYHESFSRRSYLTVGRRLADFPAALEELLRQDRFRLYRCPEVSDELILLVHAPGLIPEVAADPL